MKSYAATVGTFDGLHIGHYYLLKQLMMVAKEMDLPTRVITFFEHPMSTLTPGMAPGLLETREEIEGRILDFGIDRVSLMHFTPELAALTAREFIQLIHNRYGVAVLVMGFNNTIGSDRLSDHEQLDKIAREEGVEIFFAPGFETIDKSELSSSRLRADLSDGIVHTFTQYTGRDYSLVGQIVRGRRDGHKLGFPTLNLEVDGTRHLPKPGVYMGYVIFNDKPDKDYPAVINVGSNPTLTAGDKITVEAHVPGGKLPESYGRNAAFFFTRFLRDEKQFASVGELKAAINEDIRTMKAINSEVEHLQNNAYTVFQKYYDTIRARSTISVKNRVVGF